MNSQNLKLICGNTFSMQLLESILYCSYNIITVIVDPASIICDYHAFYNIYLIINSDSISHFCHFFCLFYQNYVLHINIYSHANFRIKNFGQ
jgi:hypothetical protein